MSIPGTSGFEAATLGDYRTRAGFYDRQQKANKPEDFPSVAPVVAESARSGDISASINGMASYFLFS